MGREDETEIQGATLFEAVQQFRGVKREKRESEMTRELVFGDFEHFESRARVRDRKQRVSDILSDRRGDKRQLRIWFDPL